MNDQPDITHSPFTPRKDMLHIARHVINARAQYDGESASDYDAVLDEEGYISSTIAALHHWCDEHGMDWHTELERAQAFFECDLRAETEGSGSS